MNTQIPLYKAKKIPSDEYIVGYYHPMVCGTETTHIIFILSDVWTGEVIDPTTLSIHLPGMLDSKGNRIFASLSEDGKGGDILTLDNEKFYIAKRCNEDGIFNILSIEPSCSGGMLTIPYAKNFTIIGIQE